MQSKIKIIGIREAGKYGLAKLIKTSSEDGLAFISKNDSLKAVLIPLDEAGQRNFAKQIFNFLEINLTEEMKMIIYTKIVDTIAKVVNNANINLKTPYKEIEVNNLINFSPEQFDVFCSIETQ